MPKVIKCLKTKIWASEKHVPNQYKKFNSECKQSGFLMSEAKRKTFWVAEGKLEQPLK